MRIILNAALGAAGKSKFCLRLASATGGVCAGRQSIFRVKTL